SGPIFSGCVQRATGLINGNTKFHSGLENSSCRGLVRRFACVSAARTVEKEPKDISVWSRIKVVGYARHHGYGCGPFHETGAIFVPTPPTRMSETFLAPNRRRNFDVA